MDTDFMKSAAEEQMEMMLMQMDKLPDFSSGAYEDVDEIPMEEFITNHNEESDDNNNMSDPMLMKNNTFFENFHVNSPTFMNPHPPNLSFSGGVHQDSPAAPPFLPSPSNSCGGGGGGRWQSDEYSSKRNSMVAMREMIFRIAAMQPIHIDPESVKPPKRKNVKISTDPQSVAARHRRERISERIRILQRLVPGGTKMDTASMLDEAIHYVKFLKNQVQSLERVAANRPEAARTMGFPVPMSSGSYFPVAAGNGYYRQYPRPHNNVQHLADA